MEFQQGFSFGDGVGVHKVPESSLRGHVDKEELLDFLLSPEVGGDEDVSAVKGNEREDAYD